jgi:hypothetical protein
VIINDVRVYELQHKCIGKKVIATQKLHSHHFKEQLKSFILCDSSMCAPFAAQHTWRQYSTENKAFFKNSHTHLAVVRSTWRSPEVSTSMDLADKPVEHYQLFPHSYSVGLNYSP